MTEVLPAVLPVVNGRSLDAARRDALRPGERVRDAEGRWRRLPTFFYEIASWDLARATTLAPNFALWEFIEVDLYEAQVLRPFPRYVPCAVVLIATALALLRQHLGQVIHIAANGGYRSPAHRHSREASPHCWGTAVNIHRIGDVDLCDQDSIERFGALATGLIPALWARPFGQGLGYADDHLHLDLGYTTLVPREAPEE